MALACYIWSSSLIGPLNRLCRKAGFRRNVILGGLIYGLPGQTPDSFRESIDYLKSRNVAMIKAFPLMLLKGTEPSKDKFQVVEEIIDDSGNPHVVDSYSFTREQWETMHHYACRLS